MRKSAALCRKVFASDGLGSALLQEWKIRMQPASRCLPREASYAAALATHRRDPPVTAATLSYSSAAPLGPETDASSSQETASFGFKTVPKEEKSGLVADVFQRVAPTYDLMNDLMSFGLHRLWKDRLVEKLRPFPGMSHLDVAGGTGDVAFRVARALIQQIPDVRFGVPPEYSPSASSSASDASSNDDSSSASGGNSSASAQGPVVQGVASLRPSAVITPASSLTVLDINPAMLAVGQERAAKSGLLDEVRGRIHVSFVQGDAEKLPLPDASMDSYTIAFGIRNVTRIDAALRDAFRVLKKGGRFLCLEFSKVEPAALRQIYDTYSFQAIPAMGRLVAGDRDSYAYLVESIRQFPDQATFAGMVEAAGFKNVSYENLHAGVVAIHSGYKL